MVIIVTLRTYEFGAKKIDVISRSAFPTCYFLFCSIYWSYYLGQAQKNPDDQP